MDARKVPWFVLPQTFVDKDDVKPYAIGAVICGGKMYYATMADTK
jgi:hypothetical protein